MRSSGEKDSRVWRIKTWKKVKAIWEKKNGAKGQRDMEYSSIRDLRSMIWKAVAPTHPRQVASDRTGQSLQSLLHTNSTALRNLGKGKATWT